MQDSSECDYIAESSRDVGRARRVRSRAMCVATKPGAPV
ncbi:unnamed protein product [Tenebrio molitor]|nr:unnamed protein product [Tenebrio molitor]